MRTDELVINLYFVKVLYASHARFLFYTKILNWIIVTDVLLYSVHRKMNALNFRSGDYMFGEFVCILYTMADGEWNTQMELMYLNSPFFFFTLSKIGNYSCNELKRFDFINRTEHSKRVCKCAELIVSNTHTHNEICNFQNCRFLHVNGIN